MNSILSQKTTYFPFLIFHLSFVIWLLLYIERVPYVALSQLIADQNRACYHEMTNDKWKIWKIKNGK